MININLTEATITSLLIFGLGMLCGHRLNLERDKRKEFNDAARPVRDWLLQSIEMPSAFLNPPSTSQFDAFTTRLTKQERKHFNNGIADYKNAINNASRRDPVSGGVYLHDVVEPKKIALALLSYTKLK